MTYRAAPVTQRDGSKLQNSNCRMASIACGLDYQTLGKKTSTGGRMRTFCDDQAGGTDSGDARQSWLRGYSEVIRVKDGALWADAAADLGAGRLVHLDVWHATLDAVCVSGSGLYGHTIAVAPEASGSRWLVSDPWCKPAKWSWVEVAKLRAGAEAWGRRAGVRAGVTSGRRWTAEEVVLIRIAARQLMGLFDPERPAPDTGGDPGDTGGPQPILYTTTKAQGATPPAPGGDMARFISSNGYLVDSGMRINVSTATRWLYLDGGDGGGFSAAGPVVCLGLLDGRTDHFVIRIKTGVPYGDGKARDTGVLLQTTNDPYPVPIQPTPVPPDDDGSYAEGWNAANAALKGEVDQLIPPMSAATGGPEMQGLVEEEAVADDVAEDDEAVEGTEETTDEPVPEVDREE